ncbi:glycosyltransferase family 4 protein [Rubellimicrobium rubrum]|uniref:Glycosyltransferase family 4 protein n=1 Tax=Rubellimicrobium rubrum TaxID=2585369 RepID=A0A5C4MM87_9RHOB|nr:glycosyltransferase family 4 protein [Rubellimicrobium rubrum]TNC46917.1 glycosyltransferase family 4 protein [Rubellimicrobium rubrum]
MIQAARRNRIAMFPWGGVLEDFLAPIGIDHVHFAETMSGGWLFGYAEALRRQGVDTVIVALSRRIDRIERRTNPHTGTETILLPAPSMYRALRRWPGDTDDPGRPRFRGGRSVQDLVRYAATPGPGVSSVLQAAGCMAILAQEYENPRFDRLVRIGRRLGMPVFASFQGAPPPGSRIERAVRRRTLRSAAGLIVASAPEAARLHRDYELEAGQVHAIPNPLDLDLWFPESREASRRALGLPADATVVICHGRIDLHRKGLDLLIAAWRDVVARAGPRDLRLHLIGSGQDDARLASLLESEPVPGLRWVRRYVTDRAEMRRELSAADLYVLPSRHEGSPVAPLEAMACGLPVVAADAPGVVDILGRQEALGGLVVAKGDAGGLSQGLWRLIADSDLRARLSAQARPRVAAFASLDVVGLRLATLMGAGPVGQLGQAPP